MAAKSKHEHITAVAHFNEDTSCRNGGPWDCGSPGTQRIRRRAKANGTSADRLLIRTIVPLAARGDVWAWRSGYNYPCRYTLSAKIPRVVPNDDDSSPSLLLHSQAASSAAEETRRSFPAKMARLGRLGFLAIAVVFHLVYIYSIFDIYFVSPIVSGMREYGLDFKEPPAKRLILFVGK